VASLQALHEIILSGMNPRARSRSQLLQMNQLLHLHPASPLLETLVRLTNLEAHLSPQLNQDPLEEGGVGPPGME